MRKACIFLLIGCTLQGELLRCAENVIGIPPLLVKTYQLVVDKKWEGLPFVLIALAGRCMALTLECEDYQASEIVSFLTEHMNTEGKRCLQFITTFTADALEFIYQIRIGRLDVKRFTDYVDDLFAISSDMALLCRQTKLNITVTNT